MTSEQTQKIKQITGYDFDVILKMTDREFFFNITRLLATKKLLHREHTWLDKQRTEQGLDATTIQTLNIFGGQLIK